MDKPNNISRRKFLGQSCAAVGYTTLLSSLINLKAFAAAAADNSSLNGGNYKALVFIMLNGGNDSFNMLVPSSDAEYAEYATTRSNLALTRNTLLPINPITTDGRQFSLNPSLTGMQNLFETNKLAFLSNVGTLIEPLTKQDYINDIKEKPLGLFSHLDQSQHWQTGRPHERTHTGWGGRVADLIQSMNTNQNISMNISLNGINTFQYGEQVIPYVITADGAVTLVGWDEVDTYNTTRRTALDTMMEKDYLDIYKNTYINTKKVSNESGLEFQAAVEALPDFATVMPANNSLAKQLRMVAKTIAARDTLGFSRQIFFVELGGFDNHDTLLQVHGQRLNVLDDALQYFQSVTEELNVADCVTTFNGSDFGRTLTSNGNGTDHAWGGNTFIMGGSVRGKDMYGVFPSLALNGNNTLEGRGIMLPSTPTDTLFAELASWFGVSNSNLDLIFPNLSNFYNTSSGVAPIGFMNI
jgi:uncharacterized protein (DUF1501 family)